MEHVVRVVQGLGIRYLLLGDSISNDYLVKALETFRPTKGLDLAQKPDKEEPFLCDIITRNYQSITLGFPITLEEVLTLTSKLIDLHSLSLTDLNALLKNWVDGWNPKLIEVIVRVTTDNDDYLSVIFEGLNYQESSNGEEDPKWQMIKYEIKRDEKKATIMIHPKRDNNRRLIVVDINSI